MFPCLLSTQRKVFCLDGEAYSTEPGPDYCPLHLQGVYIESSRVIPNPRQGASQIGSPAVSYEPIAYLLQNTDPLGKILDSSYPSPYFVDGGKAVEISPDKTVFRVDRRVFQGIPESVILFQEPKRLTPRNDPEHSGTESHEWVAMAKKLIQKGAHRVLSLVRREFTFTLEESVSEATSEKDGSKLWYAAGYAM